MLHILKGDRSVEEYTYEFLRLAYHVVNVMRDEGRVVELFVTGLGPAYIGVRTRDRRLESVIQEARQLER